MVNIMQYIRFRELFKDYTVYSLSDIRSVDPRFHRRRLNDWQEKGYIKKVIKGYYTFADHATNEEMLFEIANRIYTPSYISFEMAFSFYGFIPEAVYGLTSATSRPTRTFATPVGEFLYRTIKAELFFGYNIVEYNRGHHFDIASPEKAVLDYFYLNSSLKKPDDFESIRFDGHSFFKHVKENIFFEYLDRFKNKSLAKRINTFWSFMKNA